MSLFTTLVKPQAIPPSTTIARSSISVCARSLHRDKSKGSSQRRNTCEHIQQKADAASPSAYHQRLEDVFIRSLVAAGSCSHHPTSQTYPLTARRRFHTSCRYGRLPHADESARRFSSTPRNQYTALAAAAPTVEQEVSKEDYQELVNTYPPFGRFVSEKKKKHERERIPHFPLAPRLFLTPNQEDRPGHGSRIVLEPEDGEHAQQILHLKGLLSRKTGRVPQRKLWQAWEGLRTPRPRYLDDDTLEQLFRHLAWVEHKHAPEAMHRFLAVLNECTGEQLPLKPQVWNTAISFAGRWLRRVSSQEVKNAVEMWMRMENAGVRADTATFNILFDVAVKSGRFALADMLFSELKIRNLPPDRYSRAALIYYAGSKRDGDAVRQAFQDFVNADEIVDTAIMNTVIAALLRTGEAPAAENVFHKMKALHAKKFGAASPASWQSKRELGTLLKNVGARLRRERHQHEASFFGAAFSANERKEEIQRVTPIAPDAATFRLLIQHHAYVSADIQRIHELLAEMRARRLHVHGSVYVHVLRGYRTHGGFAFSAWNLRGLEEVWSEFLLAVAEPVPAPPAALDTAIPSPQDDRFGKPVIGAQQQFHHHAVPSPNLEATSDDNNNDSDVPQSELERKPYFTASLAIAAIRAFYHCGGHTRMTQTCDEIFARWKDVTDEERMLVQAAVDECVDHDTVYRL